MDPATPVWSLVLGSPVLTAVLFVPFMLYWTSKGKFVDPIWVAARLLHEYSATARSLRRRSVLCLRIGMFSKWAMLVSNQQPLPCEVCPLHFTQSYYVQELRYLADVSRELCGSPSTMFASVPTRLR